MRKLLIVLFCLVTLTCYGQNKPGFLKRYYEWNIMNNPDSTKLLSYDTLKLNERSILEKSKASFDYDSNSFTFLTNCGIDTIVDKTGKPVTVIGCIPFRMGKWEYDAQTNTIELLLNDKNYPILKYTIQDLDSQDVLLIKYISK